MTIWHHTIFIGNTVGLLLFSLERVWLVSEILGLHEDALFSRPECNARGFRELVDRYDSDEV